MNNKKILFNCSTNIKGGAVQNAANFIIASAKSISNYEYYYLVSISVHKIIKESNLEIENLFVLSKSPSRSFNARKYIRTLSNKIKPDLVFTMAGPAYVNFNYLHLMGCSNPYILFAKAKEILFGRNFINFIGRYLHTKYQLHFINKADYFLFQTNSSRDAYINKFNVRLKKTYVVPNAVGFKSEEYRGIANNSNFERKNKKIRILCPIEKFHHKGFHIIPKLMKYLEKISVYVHFIITIDNENTHVNTSSLNSNCKSTVSYVGNQKYSQMPEFYKNCDIVFMPSVLEIFSSVCTETLYFAKPLVVSDRSFNTDITGPYAFYCDPYSLVSCSEAIMKAIKYIGNDVYLQSSRKYIINKFGQYNNRYLKLTAVIDSILREK